MMPILDGNGVIKAIRADKRLRKIPIILASALPEKTIRERCDGFTLRSCASPTRLNSSWKKSQSCSIITASRESGSKRLL
jgi:CheY-like chemotaxis protein